MNQTNSTIVKARKETGMAQEDLEQARHRLRIDETRVPVNPFSVLLPAQTIAIEKKSITPYFEFSWHVHPNQIGMPIEEPGTESISKR